MTTDLPKERIFLPCVTYANKKYFSPQFSQSKKPCWVSPRGLGLRIVEIDSDAGGSTRNGVPHFIQEIVCP